MTKRGRKAREVWLHRQEWGWVECVESVFHRPISRSKGHRPVLFREVLPPAKAGKKRKK